MYIKPIFELFKLVNLTEIDTIRGSEICSLQYDAASQKLLFFWSQQSYSWLESLSFMLDLYDQNHL